MTTVKTLVMWSLIGIFCFGAFLFCPNFVSFPVYTTAPYLPIGYNNGEYANCVNWSWVTCRRRFCAERLTFVDWSMHSLHGIPTIFVPGVELVEVAVRTAAENLERQRVEDLMDLIRGLALKSRIQLRGRFADL